MLVKAGSWRWITATMMIADAMGSPLDVAFEPGSDMAGTDRGLLNARRERAAALARYGGSEGDSHVGR